RTGLLPGGGSSRERRRPLAAFFILKLIWRWPGPVLLGFAYSPSLDRICQMSKVQSDTPLSPSGAGCEAASNGGLRFSKQPQIKTNVYVVLPRSKSAKNLRLIFGKA